MSLRFLLCHWDKCNMPCGFMLYVIGSMLYVREIHVLSLRSMLYVMRIHDVCYWCSFYMLLRNMFSHWYQCYMSWGFMIYAIAFHALCQWDSCCVIEISAVIEIGSYSMSVRFMFYMRVMLSRWDQCYL